MHRTFIVLILLFLPTALICHAELGSSDFAGSPYNRHIIYQALILFWIGIIGLIIIIVLKLKEAKRIQDMDVHKDDEDAPFLD